MVLSGGRVDQHTGRKMYCRTGTRGCRWAVVGALQGLERMRGAPIHHCHACDAKCSSGCGHQPCVRECVTSCVLDRGTRGVRA